MSMLKILFYINKLTQLFVADSVWLIFTAVPDAGCALTSSTQDVANPDDPASGAKPTGEKGVPDPYYPIYLPIDQAFKAKYVFHHKRGKTSQERVYLFLEHPGGWLCFIYHFGV
jgi:hypothetical protein